MIRIFTSTLILLVILTFMAVGCGGDRNCSNCDADQTESVADLGGGWITESGIILELDPDSLTYYLSGGTERTIDEYEYGDYVVEGSSITLTVVEDYDGNEGVGTQPGDSKTYTFLMLSGGVKLTIFEEDGAMSEFTRMVRY